MALVHYEMDNIKKVIDEGGEILREHCESEEGSQTITDVYERHFEDIKSRDARDAKYVILVAMTTAFVTVAIARIRPWSGTGGF